MGIVAIGLLVSPAIRLCIVWFWKSLVLFIGAVISLSLYLFFIICLWWVPLLLTLLAVTILECGVLVLIRVLTARTEAIFILVTVLRLLGAHSWLCTVCWNLLLVVCFLHHLIILVMLPLLILVCLRYVSVVFVGLLDDCSLAFLGILVVVVFCEVVVMVSSTVIVVVVVVAASSSPTSSATAGSVVAFAVIPVVSIVLVVGVAAVSVLLGGIPVLIIPLIPVAVPTILTRSGIASKLRLTTRSLGATAIWRDIDV